MKLKILLSRGFKNKLKFYILNKKKIKYKILLIRGFKDNLKFYKLN